MARLILLCKDEDAGPAFRGTSFRLGHIVVNCKDNYTANWVKSQVDNLQIPDMQLKIVDNHDIPCPHILTGFFPNSLSYKNEDILSFIQIQNKILATQWKILKTIENGKNCIKVVFSVDQASYEKLKSKDFMIEYRLGMVKLLIKKEKSTETSKEPLAATSKEPPAAISTPSKSGTSIAGATSPKTGHTTVDSRKPSTAGATGSRTGHTTVDTRKPSGTHRSEYRSKQARPGRSNLNSSNQRPLLRQERVVQPSTRNRGNPWKHTREPRNERY